MKQIITVVVLLLVGVGVWRWQKAAETRKEREKKIVEDRQRVELTTYATRMRQHCESKKGKAESDLEELRDDSKRMSDVISKIMNEKNQQGEALRYDEKILHALENTDLNTLALKYMGTDFSNTRVGFAERVRIVRTAEERYEAAVKEVDDAYEQNTKIAASWGKKTLGQRDAEVARLKKELSLLESRREKLLEEAKSLMPSRGRSRMALERSERERNDHEKVLRGRLYDAESQITKKRRQIDYLQSPVEMGRIEAAAVRATQSEQRSATSRRETAMRDIDRRLKPKTTLADTISEFEKNTIGRLRLTLSDRIVEAEKTLKEVSGKLDTVNEFLLVIPVTDIQELMRLKSNLGDKP